MTFGAPMTSDRQGYINLALICAMLVIVAYLLS